jgi:hypothetical protein
MSLYLIIYVIISFFCKRARHSDCPLELPVGDSCGPDHDCSFDIKLKQCECSCHR